MAWRKWFSTTHKWVLISKIYVNRTKIHDDSTYTQRQMWQSLMVTSYPISALWKISPNPISSTPVSVLHALPQNILGSHSAFSFARILPSACQKSGCSPMWVTHLYPKVGWAVIVVNGIASQMVHLNLLKCTHIDGSSSQFCDLEHLETLDILVLMCTSPKHFDVEPMSKTFLV